MIHTSAPFYPALILEESQLPPKEPFPTCGATIRNAAIALGVLADRYTSLNTYENHAKENGRLEKIKVNGHAWKTALKIISYVLTAFILPLIALIAKALYKNFCNKQIELNKKHEPAKRPEEFEEPPRKSPDVTKIEQVKKKDNLHPISTIYANNGVNQYQVNGVACCTHFGFSFIASNKPATPSSLKDLLEMNVIMGEDFIDPERSFDIHREKIEAYKENLPMISNWGPEQSIDPANDSISVVRSEMAVTHFLNYFLGNKEIDGCVLSSGHISIALRKFGNGVEIFDSHGPDFPLTNDTKPSYVIRVQSFSHKEIIQGLLPHLNKFTNFIEGEHEVFSAYPVKLKNPQERTHIIRL